MIYLDYAATTPIKNEILDSYYKLLKTEFANSASNHALGIKVNSYLETARKQILNLFNCSNHQLIFTSGATESNNLAIKGFAYANKGKGKHIITTAIEHPSVLEVVKQLQDEGFEITILPVNNQGIIDIDLLKKSIRKDTILISVMTVNNEIGVIEPYKEISLICKEKNIVFHSDITQALGKIELDFSCFDMFSFSAHKLHGMKGSGGLLKNKNIRLAPLFQGGGQEYGLRSGTTNWPLDVILAKTIRLSLENNKESYKYLTELYLYLYNELANIKGVYLNSDSNFDIQSPYILNFSVPNRQSEVIIHGLEEHGFCVSSTSACGSKKENYSYVILEKTQNMSYANSAIRVSMSNEIKKEDISNFIKALKIVLVERN